MSGPAKWDWSTSNGTATAEATAAAYTALINGGRTAAFTAPVWNDILSKISAQRVFWTDTAWDAKTPTLAATRMSSGDRMTAVRFNTAVKNMPPIKSWPWQSYLGRTDIKAGDRCYGMYFVYLTDGLNYWIDLIPLPFAISNIATTSMAVAGRVAPAMRIQVEKPLSSIWTPMVTARSAPAGHIRYSLSVEQQGTLYVSALNAANIKIVNFFNVDFDTSVTLYPTAHIIARLNAALQHSASVTFGNCEFLNIRLPFHFTASAQARADPVMPMYVNADMGHLNIAMAISAAQRAYLAFNLSAVLRGEPRVRELDSIPISAMLEMLNSPDVTVSCQDMELVVVNLAAVFAGALRLSADTSLHFNAELLASTVLDANLSLPEVIPLEIPGDAGALSILSQFFTARGNATGVNLQSVSLARTLLATLDSILIRTTLDSTSTQTLSMSFKNAQRILSELLFESSITANPGTLRVLQVLEAMKSLLTMTADAGILERQLVQTAISTLAVIRGSAIVKNCEHFVVPLEDALTLTAAFRTTERIYTLADIYMQSAISVSAQTPLLLHSGADILAESIIYATAGVKSMLTSGVNLNSLFALQALGRLTTPTITGVNLQSVSLARATMGAALYPQYTGIALTGNSELSGRITVPTAIDSIVIVSPAVFNGFALARLLTRMGVDIRLAFQHDGQSDITLAPVSAILAALAGIQTGLATISQVDALAMYGELQMIQTVSAKLSLASLTLATDIDDVLVTDLDDMLVTDVEFSIN